MCSDGEDFDGGQVVLAFSEANGTRICLNYTIIDNTVPELAEEFFIELTSPLPAVNIQPSNIIQVSIMDDDGMELIRMHFCYCAYMTKSV